MTKVINSPIVAFAIQDKTPADDQVVALPDEVDLLKTVDECPLSKRISHRPDGELPGINAKIRYNTQEGPQKLYISVSFIQVEGVVGGQNVRIERPIEFFDNRTITGNGQQWLTATMRCLSMAARGGYIDQALEDLREVTWDKGPVRCGVNEYGKPLYHNSEVDAVAWSIQQILYRRGFLTSQGKQVPVEELVKRDFQHDQITIGETATAEATDEAGDAEQDHRPGSDITDPTVGSCPQCGSNMKLRDGCPTCVEGCGYSKCG